MQLRCMNVEVKLPYGQACSASYVRQQCANIRAPYQALAGCKTLVSDQSLFIDFGDQEAPLHVPPGFSIHLFWRCFLVFWWDLTSRSCGRMRGPHHGDYS